MMKRSIGVLAAAGILTVLVFTVLHRNNYRSVWIGEETSLLDAFGKADSAAAPLPEPSPAAAPGERPVPDAPASDSMAFDRSVDSIDSSGTADRPDTVQSADSPQ